MISLRSKLRRAVLGWFYHNQKSRVYVRQLAEILDVDSTNLSRELARLAEDGFLRYELEGRQLYYSINRHYPQLGSVLELLGDLLGKAGVPPGR